MLHTVRSGLAAATIGVVAISGAVPVSAAADDQARLDGAIGAFEERMTGAGWSGSPADDDDDSDDDVVSVGDEEFAECVGELATVFEGSESSDEFPGQTALRESLEFTYVPAGEPLAPTTDEFSFDFGPEEQIAAFAVSVDDPNAQLLDTFVDLIGAKSTGECLTTAMDAAMTADTMPDDIAIEFEADVENAADLGVGDRSARMRFVLSTKFLGMPITFDVNMLMARVDRDLVMVIHSLVATEQGISGLDPVEELALLADSLAG